MGSYVMSDVQSGTSINSGSAAVAVVPLAAVSVVVQDSGGSVETSVDDMTMLLQPRNSVLDEVMT